MKNKKGSDNCLFFYNADVIFITFAEKFERNNEKNLLVRLT